MTNSTLTADEILAKLQGAYDVVKARSPRTLTLDDKLIDDLKLDSLDLIDVVSVLEESFPPDVVDTVIEQSGDIETVGELVRRFADAA